MALLKKLFPSVQPIIIPSTMVTGLQAHIKVTLTCDSLTLSEKQRKLEKVRDSLVELAGANGVTTELFVVLEGENGREMDAGIVTD